MIDLVTDEQVADMQDRLAPLFALDALSFLAGDDGGPAIRAIARATIETEGDSRAPVSFRSVEELATELRDRVRGLAGRMGTEEAWPPGDAEPPSRDGMLWADAIGADFFAEFGANGAADAIRHAARERWATFKGAQPSLPGLALETGRGHQTALWRLWWDASRLDQPVKIIDGLAQCLWSVVVRPRLERTRPALSLALLDPITDAFLSRGRKLAEDGITILGRNGAPVGASLQPRGGRQIPADIAIGLSKSASLASHRLIRWIVAEIHARYALGKVDARVIGIRGGSARVAELAGIPRGQEHVVREVLNFYHHATIQLPHGEIDGLLLWSEQYPTRGRPAYLEIVGGSPLCPNYVFNFARGDGRLLLPLPAGLPPLYGRDRDHAAQCVLQLQVLGEIRRRSEELLDPGGVLITGQRWRQLADRAEVPGKIVDSVRETWIAGQPNAPAFLQPAGHERYILAPAYRREHDLLVEGAIMSREGRARRNGPCAHLTRKRGPVHT